MTGTDDGSESVTEQDILKVFDRVHEPFLTATEIAEQVGFTRQAALYRLKQMRKGDLVARKDAGARAVGWWAKVAPAPSEATLRDIEAAKGEVERGEAISQEEMKRRFGLNHE